MKSEYVYAVISIENDGKLHQHISHYLCKSHQDALKFKEMMESDTDDKFVILTLLKMNSLTKIK